MRARTCIGACVYELLFVCISLHYNLRRTAHSNFTRGAYLQVNVAFGEEGDGVDGHDDNRHTQCDWHKQIDNAL